MPVSVDRAAEHDGFAGCGSERTPIAEPGRAETERAADVAGLGRGLAAGSDPDNGVSPGRRVRRRPDVEQAAGRFEEALQSTGRHEHGTPDVVRRDRVVRIGDTGQVRRPLGPDPDVLDGGRPAARGREEVRRRDLGRRRARPRRRSPGRPRSSTAPRARSRGRPGCACRGRGRTSDPVLRTASAYERAATAWAFSASGSPVVRHLRRDDAVEVLLEPDHVDRPQTLADLVDLDRAPVGRRPSCSGASPGRNTSGAGSAARCWRPSTLTFRPGPNTCVPAASSQVGRGVAHAERRLGGDRQRSAPCRRAGRAPCATGAGPSVVPR